MKNAIRIVLILFSVNLNSQITTEIMDPIVYENFDFSEWDIKINILVKNTSTDTINLKWEIKREEEHCEEEWRVSHYDYNLCYTEFITSNVDPDFPIFNPVVMPPGFEYYQILVVYPDQDAGCCQFSFDFSDAENPDEILATTYLPIQINQENCFTSTNDDESEEINVYPNPFNDYIKLENGEEIKSVKIYNVKGQLVNTQVVKSNTVQELAQLAKGTYLVTFYNDKDEAIKTVSMIKE